MTLLAEALIERAGKQKRFAQLKSRLLANAKVQEGDQAAIMPDDILKEMESNLQEVATLVRQINRTNMQTSFDDKQSLADVLATRDMLGQRHKMLLDLAEASVIKNERWSRNEIRFVSAVDSAEITKQADQVAQAYRQLDIKIQALNWSTELVD